MAPCAAMTLVVFGWGLPCIATSRRLVFRVLRRRGSRRFLGQRSRMARTSAAIISAIQPVAIRVNISPSQRIKKLVVLEPKAAT